MYLLFFVGVNIGCCFFIPYILDYAHNYLNGFAIPEDLYWDKNGRRRQNLTAYTTLQLVILLIEWAGCLWLLYRFNRSNVQIWLDQPVSFARSVPWLITGFVGVVILFARGGLIIWLTKQYFSQIK